MRKAVLYRPGRDFPSVSVTGGRCELMCDHCRGRYLQGMLSATSPQELLSLARGLEERGATGLLLSGGCDRQGKVPLAPFLPAVRKIKAATKLKVNLHPGLVSELEAKEIASSGADRISFDLVLDPEVLRQRMHLDRSPGDYLRSFGDLCRAAPGKVAPHILLGLGSEEKELEAVQVAGKEEVPCIILLSLIGEGAVDWEGRLMRAVRTGASTGRPVLLGCMRPRGHPEVELAALEAGAAGIACPSPSTARALEDAGWEVDGRRGCCALYL